MGELASEIVVFLYNGKVSVWSSPEHRGRLSFLGKKLIRGIISAIDKHKNRYCKSFKESLDPQGLSKVSEGMEWSHAV